MSEVTMKVKMSPTDCGRLVVSHTRLAERVKQLEEQLSEIRDYALECARSDIESASPDWRVENGVRWYRLDTGEDAAVCQDALAVLRQIDNITEKDGWVTWGESA
jgi:Asp-tRNA(Asn)/Glu-tRNA(Gln) amidotransferase C subunit